ncbi:uncharacterized protein LOC126108606 [Schistocerca cancellata]|uniref:uncharacterized protein LOC126108606 n=1 Tax=Schistocerca cancellata TaxID=274614 RepID=UPI00211865E9|nr:uncharacterized protein LOC126108606 [Schistocerca cancellata]
MACERPQRPTRARRAARLASQPASVSREQRPADMARMRSVLFLALLFVASCHLSPAASAGAVRIKRGTCDNSIDEMNRLACNAYCVAQLNGYSGGKCFLGTCICYK